MNPRPPPSPRSLDAEERALAKALPRLHGRTAPGPDLDASILAAAQDAVRPARAASTPAGPRSRWIAPAALAASMVLAVGLAWQLRPLPALDATNPMPASAATDMPTTVMIEPGPGDEVALEVQSKQASPAAPARQQAPFPSIGAQEAAPTPPPSSPARRAPELSPPPAPPAPSLPQGISGEAVQRTGSSAPASGNVVDAQAGAHPMRARENADAAAANASSDAAPAIADKARETDTTRPPAPKTVRPVPSAAPAAVRNEAAQAADAGFVDDPDQDIPPATAASPAVRDAWLHRIGELLEQGEREQAKASLAEFRRRYPAATLPPALRAIEIEP